MFQNSYKGKVVLVTGHTGFKGSWLVTWLLKLGAKVIGVSKDIPTNPSMFESLNIEKKILHNFIDIRNLKKLKTIISEHNPDFIFHLAAQAIVSKSYSDPVDTVSTNVMGTMNILEALRFYKKKCITIIITSDKCYDNIEQSEGYKETDAIGGKDVYSGSKGAAELIIKSYFHSFFKKDHSVRLAIGRAGNVIGGGDFAQDRIIVDTINSWKDKNVVEIRSPDATRPWQHVLEPLSGYLALGAKILNDNDLNGEPFNFGPVSSQDITVKILLQNLAEIWGWNAIDDAIKINDSKPTFNEAGLLKLNCNKAKNLIKWEPNLNFNETLIYISDWYKKYFLGSQNMYDFTLGQIDEYEKLGIDRKRDWIK
jgi:CDP-glucose 4,6-dehydratase